MAKLEPAELGAVRIRGQARQMRLL